MTCLRRSSDDPVSRHWPTAALVAAAGLWLAAGQPLASRQPPPAEPLAVLQAKQQITEAIYRYSRGLDRMDKAMSLSVWNPGATADYTPNYKGTGTGFVDWVFGTHARMKAHSHQMTNILIDVNGDKAVSETYALISLQSAPRDGKTSISLVRCRYLDRWSKGKNGWGLDHRQNIIDFQSSVQTPDTNPVTPSRRDTTDPSYALFGR